MNHVEHLLNRAFYSLSQEDKLGPHQPSDYPYSIVDDRIDTSIPIGLSNFHGSL